MTKKNVIFLSLPSVLFAALAGLLSFHANDLLLTPQEKRQTEINIQKLELRAKKGDYGPKPDPLVELLSDSYRAQDRMRETLTTSNAETSRAVSCGLFLGVALQFYIIFRVKTEWRKR
jgi:hypothetical protein